ncbi:hypothetical protein [Stenomitos frigidus]|uniref:hypothetical protein n=1 Tax=Stenomitos frigidus TaxID=1886765 RepID=UPI0011B204C6|nr:hypothetical protein [Stenomitos frigidus]
MAQPSRKPEASGNQPTGTLANAKAKQAASVKPLKQPKQPEAIAVAIDPERNVNWQQVFASASSPVTSAKMSRSPQSSAPATKASPTQARTNLSTEAAKDLHQLAE